MPFVRRLTQRIVDRAGVNYTICWHKSIQSQESLFLGVFPVPNRLLHRKIALSSCVLSSAATERFHPDFGSRAEP